MLKKCPSYCPNESSDLIVARAVKRHMGTESVDCHICLSALHASDINPTQELEHLESKLEPTGISIRYRLAYLSLDLK